MSQMPSMPMNTTTVTTSAPTITDADLRRIEGKLDRILAILEPANADPAEATLVQAIWGPLGAGTFTTWAVFDRVTIAEDAALRAALMGADVTTPTELGWLLHRLQGRVIGGLLVQRVDSVRDGRLWRIVRSSSPELREP